MMKKLKVFAVAVLITALVTGCGAATGNNQVKTEKSSASATKTTEVKTSDTETVKAEDVLDTAKKDPKAAAESLNKIKDKDTYKKALRDVLDYYYTKDSDSRIDTFTAAADSRSDSIVTNYAEAAKERDDADDLNYFTGEILLIAKDGVSDSDIKDMAEDQRGECTDIKSLSGDTKMAVVDISKEYTVKKAAANFEKNDDILYAQPNYIYEATDENVAEEQNAVINKINSTDSNVTQSIVSQSINDSYAYDQWYLDNANADINDAWTIINNTSHSRVKVAVIDTGVLTTHEDLKSSGSLDTSLCRTINNGSISTSISDGDGHGTHVSGIIAAQQGNSKGIAGVASSANNNVADLFVINASVWDSDYQEYLFSTQDLIYSIDYAVSKGARLINMSLGGKSSGDDAALQTEIEVAYAAGTLCICAAGNAEDGSDKGTTAAYTPSDFDEVISVISTTPTNTKSDFSNYGSAKDISAPGGGDIASGVTEENETEGILSLYNDGGYAWMWGTSQATPIVTGVAAMMLSVNPNLSVSQVKTILYETAKDLGSSGRDNSFGWGLVQAGDAVQTAKNTSGDIVYDNYISTGSTKSGSFSKTTSGNFAAGDENYSHMKGYYFQGTAGYKVTLTLSSSSLDTYMKLYNSSGSLVALNDDIDSQAGNYNSKITYTLPSSGLYYIWVSEVGNEGGSYSLSSSYVDANIPKLSKPSITLKTGKKKIYVKWKKVSGAGGYKIYRATSKYGKYKKVKTITKGSTLKWTNKKLKGGRKYWYKVRAYKSYKGKTYYSSYSARKYKRTKR